MEARRQGECPRDALGSGLGFFLVVIVVYLQFASQTLGGPCPCRRASCSSPVSVGALLPSLPDSLLAAGERHATRRQRAWKSGARSDCAPRHSRPGPECTYPVHCMCGSLLFISTSRQSLAIRLYRSFPSCRPLPADNPPNGSFRSLQTSPSFRSVKLKPNNCRDIASPLFMHCQPNCLRKRLEIWRCTIRHHSAQYNKRFEWNAALTQKARFL